MDSFFVRREGYPFLKKAMSETDDGFLEFTVRFIHSSVGDIHPSIDITHEKRRGDTRHITFHPEASLVTSSCPHRHHIKKSKHRTQSHHRSAVPLVVHLNFTQASDKSGRRFTSRETRSVGHTHGNGRAFVSLV